MNSKNKRTNKTEKKRKKGIGIREYRRQKIRVRETVETEKNNSEKVETE